LADIADAIAAVQRFTRSHDLRTFSEDDLVQSAVLQKLIVIGEAAGRLPLDLHALRPDVPWRKIVAFRNFAVHEYFAVSWAIVWTVVTDDLPTLAGPIAELLTEVNDML
jgi:uncharacterized protein with HEPN domain